MWIWDNGQEFYRECLRFHLSYNVTAQEIHQTGLQELARIKGNMVKVFRLLFLVYFVLKQTDFYLKQFFSLDAKKLVLFFFMCHNYYEY